MDNPQPSFYVNDMNINLKKVQRLNNNGLVNKLI